MLDEVPKVDGLAPNAEGVVDPNADGVDEVVPKAERGCPNVVFDVVLPKAEVVLAGVEDEFADVAPLDPNENAEAGIAPNGDVPNDEADLLNDEVPPRVH